jgi:ubiquinol-cytochrome c reductase cytochrome b subunit
MADVLAVTWRRRFGGWVEERFGVSAFAYSVPRHANRLPYLLGGVTAGSFLMLVVTGVYLAQQYDPTVAQAHGSVVRITASSFGGVVRNVHYWLATILMVTLALHVLRTFLSASYKRPREGIWLTGVGLFLFSGLALYTGTILKWDQEAIEALAHNSELGKLAGIFGFWFSDSFSSHVSLLTRDYVAHVSVLPLLFGFGIGVHMLLIKRLKISPFASGSPAEIEARAACEPQEPFTRHLLRLGALTLATLGLSLLLTAIHPAGIGPQGVEGIEVTKPPWYFLWVYPFEDWFGLRALFVAPALLMLGLALVPFVDRNAERDPRRRRAWVALAAVVVVAWIGLSVYGYVTRPVSHVGM